MNTQKQQIIIVGLLALLVGLAIGFCAGKTSYGHHVKGGYENMRSDRNMMNGHMMMQGDGMKSMMMDMNAGLMGKTGDEFDKAFLAEMIMHHEGAVQMAKQVLATSKRPELLKLANDIIAAQTKEIEMMKTWQTTWFK